MQNEILVFVYGTLMTGHGNNFFLSGADYLDIAETEEKYFMSSNMVPFVSKTRGLDSYKTTIKGELFAVDEAILSRLDQLEGHPNWYKREKVKLVTVAGFKCDAWIYFNEKSVGSSIIRDGDYKNFMIKGAA